MMAEVIRIARGGATREQVSSMLSLPLDQADSCLRFLQKKALLKNVSDSGFYAPTVKGLSYLDLCDEALELIVPVYGAPYSRRQACLMNPTRLSRSQLRAQLRQIIDP